MWSQLYSSLLWTAAVLTLIRLWLRNNQSQIRPFVVYVPCLSGLGSNLITTRRPGWPDEPPTCSDLKNVPDRVVKLTHNVADTLTSWKQIEKSHFYFRKFKIRSTHAGKISLDMRILNFRSELPPYYKILGGTSLHDSRDTEPPVRPATSFSLPRNHHRRCT